MTIDSFVKIDNTTSEFQIDGVVHTISLEDFEAHHLFKLIIHLGIRDKLTTEENITKGLLIEVLYDNGFDIESNIEYLLEFGYHEALEERCTLNETMFNEGELDIFEKKTKKGRKVYLCYRNGSDWLYEIIRITFSDKGQKIKFFADNQTEYKKCGITEIGFTEIGSYNKVKNILNECVTKNGSHYIAETLNAHFKQEFFKNK